MQIILASASKRRQELLKSLGLVFKIIPSQIDEKSLIKNYKNPKELVVRIALAKALAVEPKIRVKEFLIISADTFVFLNHKIIGKPKNRKEAEKIIRLLRGKSHQVLTGISLLDSQGRKKTAIEVTKVKFKHYPDKAIKGYLNTGVYLDRAGAYGIQDEKCDFIESFKGSYTNILGLPLEKLTRLLKEFGVK